MEGQPRRRCRLTIEMPSAAAGAEPAVGAAEIQPPPADEVLVLLMGARPRAGPRPSPGSWLLARHGVPGPVVLQEMGSSTRRDGKPASREEGLRLLESILLNRRSQSTPGRRIPGPSWWGTYGRHTPTGRGQEHLRGGSPTRVPVLVRPDGAVGLGRRSLRHRCPERLRREWIERAAGRAGRLEALEEVLGDAVEVRMARRRRGGRVADEAGGRMAGGDPRAGFRHRPSAAPPGEAARAQRSARPAT